MTDEPQVDSGGPSEGEPQAGEPPAIVLYAIYAVLAAVLIAVFILVGIYT